MWSELRLNLPADTHRKYVLSEVSTHFEPTAAQIPGTGPVSHPVRVVKVRACTSMPAGFPENFRLTLTDLDAKLVHLALDDPILWNKKITAFLWCEVLACLGAWQILDYKPARNIGGDSNQTCLRCNAQILVSSCAGELRKDQRR